MKVQAGYEGKVKIGMDVAASEFYTEDKMYDLDFKTKDNDGSQKKTGAQMQVRSLLSWANPGAVAFGWVGFCV